MTRGRPTGVTLIASFIAAGAVIAGTSAASLAFPGSILEPMWRLKPSARVDFERMDGWAVPLLVLVALACAVCAFGLFRQRPWARPLVIVLLSVNLAGDLGNFIIRHDPRTLIGLPIGGLVIWYLARLPRSAMVHS